MNIQERLKSLYYYDAGTGQFFYRNVEEIHIISKKRIKCLYDKASGQYHIKRKLKISKIKLKRKNNPSVFSKNQLTSGKYLTLSLDKRETILAHRAAWIYIYGESPRKIDHRNRVKSDNRIVNLRGASSQCNSRNCEPVSNLVKGVSVGSKGYSVCISCDNINTYIGVFGSFVEAVAHRLAAEQFLGYPDCYSSNNPTYKFFNQLIYRDN